MLGCSHDVAISLPRKYLDVSSWKVRAGSNKLGNSPSLPVAKIFIAEPNPLQPKEKDIALVRLKMPLTFSGRRWSPATEPLGEPYSGSAKQL